MKREAPPSSIESVSPRTATLRYSNQALCDALGQVGCAHALLVILRDLRLCTELGSGQVKPTAWDNVAVNSSAAAVLISWQPYRRQQLVTRRADSCHLIDSGVHGAVARQNTHELQVCQSAVGEGFRPGNAKNHFER